MTVYEYLVRNVALDPAEVGQASAALNGFAAQGWRLVSSAVVVTAPRLQTDFGQATPGVALLCVFERVKTA